MAYTFKNTKFIKKQRLRKCFRLKETKENMLTNIPWTASEKNFSNDISGALMDI